MFLIYYTKLINLLVWYMIENYISYAYSLSFKLIDFSQNFDRAS